MNSLRVLVIDDSPLMRRLLTDRIHAVPGMEVVATGDDGSRIVELYEQYRPHVVTLDIQMPRCDGLAALDLLMAHAPVPVVMVSSFTRLGADITLEALDRGAVEYVAKPDNMARAEHQFIEELGKKIRIAAGTQVARLMSLRRARLQSRQQRMQKSPPRSATTAPVSEMESLRDCLIAIGISTGGPPALHALLEQLRPPLPPIAIVQHMPAMFTKAFAGRLDHASEISVKEASTGEALLPNHAYVAPGGKHLEVVGRGSDFRLVVRDGDPIAGHRPSVDVLFKSAAPLYCERLLGLIMTGMGRDGVQGCAAVRSCGGYVLGQDEATSDVYGMNKIAFQEGHVDRQFALADCADEITQHVRMHWTRRRVSAR